MKVHNYKYQTKQWMPEHEYNLYDFGARMYDPVLVRFTTPDPLQQFYNPYKAMGGNPVSMIDPSGMWSTNSFDNNIAAAQEKAMFGRKSSAPSGLSKIIVDGLQINSPSSGFLSNIASQTMQTGASITEPGQVAFTWSSLQTLNPEKKGEKLTLSTWGSTHSLQKAEWKFSDAAMGASDKRTAEFRQTTGNVYTLGSEVEVDGNDADAQANGGYNFDRFIDDVELSYDLWGPLGNGADNILRNRGAYMPRGEIYRVNKPITVRTPLFNVNTTSKVLNYARVGGKVLGAANILATGYEIGQDWNEGKYKSAGARAAVYGLAAGAAFIPVVGWGVSIGIGVLDYMYGDDFYNWVEKQ